MVTVLAALSGLAWTVVYLDCIRVGFRDRTYAMPVAALALNIAWESLHAVHGLATTVSMQTGCRPSSTSRGRWLTPSSSPRSCDSVVASSPTSSRR